MTRELRDYQQEAVDAVRASWARGTVRTGVVMATGLGKTSVIGQIATDEARAGGRVLCLAHRAELLDQIARTCREFAPDVLVGRVQASTNQHRRPIVVASAQTLAGAKRRARMLPPTMVIVDEAHHAVSPGQMKILEWAGSFEQTRTLGVTATMVRGDKRGLGDVWKEVCFSRDIAWAVEHGWLVRPHGRVVVGEHMDLNKAKISRGDFQDGELGEMVAQDVEEIVKAWQAHAADRITIGFTPTVDSARELADAFLAQGVAAETVFGSTPHGERGAVYRRLAAGTTRVMLGVGVHTEGFDCPPVSCVLNARPTKLPGLYTQMVGRGLRLSHDTGKTDCLVLDVVGASRTQRLVTLVDLHPSAEVNRDELDALPCERCGGYVKTPSDAAPMPCSCACEDCGELVADCRCGPGPRDPDGGRRRLRGPAAYADVDLLDGLADSSFNWLRTPGGISFLSAGKYLAAVIPDAPDGGRPRFSAGYCEAWGGKPGVDLVENVNIDEARGAVEAWAMREGAHRRAAPWRLARKGASEQAQQLAARLGVESPEQWTAGGLSDAIDIARASRRFDR